MIGRRPRRTRELKEGRDDSKPLVQLTRLGTATELTLGSDGGPIDTYITRFRRFG
jgi:hypothetical protein